MSRAGCKAMTVTPEFPVYIVSKGRATCCFTARYLERMGVPYRLVVERQEVDAYAAEIEPARLLVLDPAYQRDYDTCDDLGDTKGRGPGPARNFVWEHARSLGAPWHWVMDDNIRGWHRLNHNAKIQVTDGTVFKCMEDFVQRYKNIVMAGPNYRCFVQQREDVAPLVWNTRIYSCNLIRNDVPFRWRGRYNEDTDLSLRMLKAGHCTVQFNAFLQNKLATQSVKGGNTAEFYAREGTLPKSRMQVALHPDVSRLVFKFGRWHHHVNYLPFKGNKPIRRKDLPASTGIDNYGMVLKAVPPKPTVSAA